MVGGRKSETNDHFFAPTSTQKKTLSITIIDQDFEKILVEKILVVAENAWFIDFYRKFRKFSQIP